MVLVLPHLIENCSIIGNGRIWLVILWLLFQGLNYIAGLMLLIVRKEEVAFWLLDVIVGNLLPGIVINSILLQLIILLLKSGDQMLPSVQYFSKIILKVNSANCFHLKSIIICQHFISFIVFLTASRLSSALCYRWFSLSHNEKINQKLFSG